MAQHRDAQPERLFEQTRIRAGALGALLVLLVLGFCFLSVSMLRAMHRDAWRGAIATSQNLLRAQSEEIDRSLANYDASLLSASVAWADLITRHVSPDLERLVILSDLDTGEDLGPVRILGADGAVLYDSVTPTPADSTAAEQRALAYHRVHAGAGPMISPPFGQPHGTFAMTLSRRISAPDGSFMGAVVGTIDLRVFYNQLSDLDLGPHDLIGLFTTRGVVLARMPDENLIGRAIIKPGNLRRVLNETSGTYVDKGAGDGKLRAFSFRHVAGWPLILIVGLSTADLFSPWFHRAATTGLLLGVMVVLALLLLWLMRRDLSVRQRAAKALAASEARYRALAENASDLIVRADRNMVRTYVSPSSRHFGYEPEELAGIPATSLMHEEDLPGARQVLLSVIETGVERELICRLRAKDGRYVWTEAHVSPVENGGYLSVIRDIDKRKQDELRHEEARQALAHLAATDALTRLANRRIFDDSLAKYWEDAMRSGKAMSLLMIDVDHFKAYNDRYGHQGGDGVLVAVARLVGRNVKRAGDTTARYGGEEFAVLLPATDIYGAIEVAEAIRLAVWEAALEHDGSPLGRVTVSVGAATAMPRVAADTAEALLRAADEELYRGKQAGRNRVNARALVWTSGSTFGEKSLVLQVGEPASSCEHVVS